MEKTQKALQVSLSGSGRKKMDMFLKETQEMLEKGQDLFRSKKSENFYYRATNTSVFYIKPLLESTWQYYLTTFQSGFENLEE